ncbi:unnamed protein product [Mytilus edulis]|uniref:Uncharacterized protein n=1 Tax=Mytilus edulis TaxID=6550 RepID=A0A8S3Q1P5_MYTED|nr:unnamed protein product [Mytilus edulis]
MCCKEGEVNLARWCLEYHLHENQNKSTTDLCFFLLIVFYNQLEEAIINDGLIKRTDRQFSFKTMLHIPDEISAKEVINELNTSLKLVGVAKEAGVYSIRSDMFHFLVFYFASIRQMSKYLVEFADEKLLCESFIAEKSLFHQHNFLILLPEEEYLTCINREITSIIENSSIDFIYELCVLTAKAIQDHSDGEPEHYIVIPDDCTAIYIKRIFDHVAKSDCVEECLQGNRNNRNETFYSKLFIHMNELNRDEVERLIHQASSDFVNRIFVISEKDINHESCWEYERYGIVVPEDLLQIYIERVFSDMTQSVHEPVNRNSGNKTFRDTLYSYINSFSEDELTSLIQKASSKFIGRLFLSTESYSESIGLPRVECNYMFIPQNDVPIQKRKIQKMPFTCSTRMSNFKDSYEIYKFKHDSTEFTVTFHDNKGRDNMFITVTSMNKICIDNLQQHLVQFIDPLL